MENKPVYSGFLLVPPIGKILIKKTWQQKRCLLYSASKFGIERLEIFDGTDSVKNSPQRIIPLNNCIKITQKYPTIICIFTKNATYEFGTMSTVFLNEWLSALQSVAFPDDHTKTSSIEEDNDLYCSSGEGVFSVKLHSSEASLRCGLEPKFYTLVLTSTAIQLRNACDNNYLDSKIIYSWPYCFIRKYGYREGKFTFEAGRKCVTGEGTFYLEHSNQQEIYRCLASKMKSMKKLLKGETTPPILDCGDNQFQAALSMEARSRSPLPPSPATFTTTLDIDTSISNLSQLSLHDSALDLLNHNRNPFKPPRKSVENVSASDYEPIDKYDEIEFRNDAWKTLGVDDVKHTENLNDENCAAQTPPKKEQNGPIQTPKAPTIIKNDLTDTSYDSLDFFGTAKKKKTFGYKQVSPVPVNPQPVQKTFNDYDEVLPVMEGVRLADDSHLGYALIRKEPKVNHQFHNEDPYAVISKPKRV